MKAGSNGIQLKTVHTDGLTNCTSGCYFLNEKNGKCERKNSGGISVAVLSAETISQTSCETHPMIWIKD